MNHSPKATTIHPDTCNQKIFTRTYPVRGQTQTPTRVHSGGGALKKLPPGERSKSKKSTLLPHIEDLYKGVGGK